MLLPRLQRVWSANLKVYGADKVWSQLNCEDIALARCTVDRVMKQLGFHGARWGKRIRTTVADKAALCPMDKVIRHFKASRPDQLWESDFTYVSTCQGWLYVVVFARRSVGWGGQ